MTQRIVNSCRCRWPHSAVTTFACDHIPCHQLLWLQVPWKEAQLAAALDPAVQAKQAQQLNLELMKWRAAPRLDLSAMADKKCLILGVRRSFEEVHLLPVVFVPTDCVCACRLYVCLGLQGVARSAAKSRAASSPGA